ncbi:hypothetical protein CEQ90_00705 [Lewinellaceae bacterium SD302]|nr:hypothetical protein CEQ90_00705 [Lewinellaceae bacterium SD302]
MKKLTSDQETTNVMSRLLFLPLLFFCSLVGSACSCIDLHTPLEDVICNIDSTGGIALEIRVTDIAANGITVAVERKLVGEFDLTEFFISDGSSASCGWNVSSLAVGSRFLYFTSVWALANNSFETFTCGFSNNLYELNEQKTEINYPTQGEVFDNGRFYNADLAWRDYPYTFAEPDCGTATGVQLTDLDRLIAFPNPGNGRLAFRVPDNGAVKGLIRITIYNIAGRAVGKSLYHNDAPGINLTNLPSGVYLLQLTNGEQLRTVRYVKQ